MVSTSSSAYSFRSMTSTGPNVRTFLRFLTGRRTLLISAPFSRGVMFVLGNVIKPQGLEPLQFPTKFRAPSRFGLEGPPGPPPSPRRADRSSLRASFPACYAAIRACRRLVFNARHTKSHSPCTFASPRRLKRRNPRTCVIQPLGASDSHLRSAYAARPAGLDSFSAMRLVAGYFSGSRGLAAFPSRPKDTYPSMPRVSRSAKSRSLL